MKAADFNAAWRLLSWNHYLKPLMKVHETYPGNPGGIAPSALLGLRQAFRHRFGD